MNEGWLDRATYVPVVIRAFELLMRRVDAAGNLAGIQLPGLGPDCARVGTSNDGVINLNYGPGAVLLAAAEILKFSDEDLRGLGR